MKRKIPLIVVSLLALTLFTGCEFIGSVFQTGVGVGIFIAVAVLILIFFIGRIGRRKM